MATSSPQLKSLALGLDLFQGNLNLPEDQVPEVIITLPYDHGAHGHELEIRQHGLSRIQISHVDSSLIENRLAYLRPAKFCLLLTAY